MYILMHLAEKDWDNGQSYMLFIEEAWLNEAFPRLQADFQRAAGMCSLNGGPLAEMVFVSPLEQVYQLRAVHGDDLTLEIEETAQWLEDQLHDNRVIPMKEIPACVEPVRRDSCKLIVTDGRVEWSVRLRGENSPRFTETVTITAEKAD